MIWIESKNLNGFSTGKRLSIDEPAPTVMAYGMGGDKYSSVLLNSDGEPDGHHMGSSVSKPPYRVPSMAEVDALEPNGFSVVSTFSGAGGSCLGFRMAGFEVLWASEFIPAARATYRANNPNTILDARDIRAVKPEEILSAIGLGPGELDVFEGSPPCASFSTAGKRSAGWGRVKAYSDTKQRTDDLFFEFARLLAGLRPRVFVAENVSGLVKGVAKGYFLEILAALKKAGYRVEARLLDAQWLGVPQMRQRLIFVGVREDLGLAPAFPKPLPYRYSVREALPWIARIEVRNGRYEDASVPARTVRGSDDGRSSTTQEIDTGHCEVLIEDANGYSKHAGYSIDRPMDTIQAQRPVNLIGPRAYLDKRGAFGHDGDCTDGPAPTVLADSVGTHWIEADRVEPEAELADYAIGREWDKLKEGESTYYGGRLWKPSTDKSCPTITQRGGDGGVADVIHPTERRKFTIAELKRICAFPDDFVICGRYNQQWERLGRAVPPIMMMKVAEAVRDRILVPLRERGTIGPARRSPGHSTSD